MFTWVGKSSDSTQPDLICIYNWHVTTAAEVSTAASKPSFARRTDGGATLDPYAKEEGLFVSFWMLIDCSILQWVLSKISQSPSWTPGLHTRICLKLRQVFGVSPWLSSWYPNYSRDWAVPSRNIFDKENNQESHRIWNLCGLSMELWLFYVIFSWCLIPCEAAGIYSWQ